LALSDYLKEQSSMIPLFPMDKQPNKHINQSHADASTSRDEWDEPKSFFTETTLTLLHPTHLPCQDMSTPPFTPYSIELDAPP
jgi:C1A family cysteine protease